MGSNFNPGFDREKKAFLDLANRGDGLTPINYLFADEANFESVLASYVKGGTFDIGMMYVININAKTILANIIDANIAYIDIAYARQLHIEEIFVDYVLATEAYVEEQFGVGVRNGKDWPKDQNPQARFYINKFIVDGSSFDSSAASFDLKTLFSVHSTTTTMTSNLLTSLQAGGAFNITSGLATVITAGAAIIMSAIGTVSINPFASYTPCGSVYIYSQSLVETSAPLLKFGNTDPTMLLAITNTILMKTTALIEARTMDFTVYADNNIILDAEQDTILYSKRMNTTSFEETDIKAYSNMDISSFKEMTVYAQDVLNLLSQKININGSDNINMSSLEFLAEFTTEATIATKDLELLTYDKLTIKATFAEVNIDVSAGNLYFNTPDYGGILRAYFDKINISGKEEVNVFCKDQLNLVSHKNMYITTLEKMALVNGQSSIVLSSNNPGNDKINIKTPTLDIEVANSCDVNAKEGILLDGSDVYITNDLIVLGKIQFGEVEFIGERAGKYTWKNPAAVPEYILRNIGLTVVPPTATGTTSFTLYNVMTCNQGVIQVKNITITLNYI